MEIAWEVIPYDFAELGRQFASFEVFATIAFYCLYGNIRVASPL